MSISFNNGSFSYGQFIDFCEKIIHTVDPDLNFFSSDIFLQNYSFYPLVRINTYDGECIIPHEQINAMVPELEKIINSWENKDDDIYDYDSFLKSMGLQMVEGMKDAVKNNKPFAFN